jgi:hypothetical protein
MTERGAQDQGVSRSGLVVFTGSRRNRPVLLRPDGTCITMGEARNEFGAKSVVISSSRLRLNGKLILKTRSKLNCSRSGWALSDCTATPPWAQNSQQRQLRR